MRSQILLGIGAPQQGVSGLADTVSYGDTASLSYWVKNESPVNLSPLLISTQMQINNGVSFVAGTFNLSNILLPGDSVLITIPNFIFDKPSQQGGTNVIVMWPTGVGTQPKDSLRDSTYIRDTTTSIRRSQSYPEAKIWPNPVRQHLNYPQYPPFWGLQTIQIYDRFGQQVQEINPVNNPDRRISITEQAEGIYFIRFVFDNHSTLMKKFYVHQ